MITNIVDTKYDIATSKRYFVDEALEHPARMSLSVLRCLTRTHMFAGQTVIDPMAGIGTTMLCALFGINVILSELKQAFVDVAHENLRRMLIAEGCNPFLHIGQVTIKQGDARHLNEALADAILFSPPYGNSIAKVGGINKKLKRLGRSCLNARQYSDSPDDIGNLPLPEYLTEMRKVYLRCWACLKPDGVLIVVLRNYVRDRIEVKLGLHTIRICTIVGFTHAQTHEFKIMRQTFWRNWRRKIDPDYPAINMEYALVFKKSK